MSDYPRVCDGCGLPDACRCDNHPVRNFARRLETLNVVMFGKLDWLLRELSSVRSSGYGICLIHYREVDGDPELPFTTEDLEMIVGVTFTRVDESLFLANKLHREGAGLSGMIKMSGAEAGMLITDAREHLSRIADRLSELKESDLATCELSLIDADRMFSEWDRFVDRSMCRLKSLEVKPVPSNLRDDVSEGAENSEDPGTPLATPTDRSVDFINQRMMSIIKAHKREAFGYSSRRWAGILGVSKTQIIKTRTWQLIMERRSTPTGSSPVVPARGGDECRCEASTDEQPIDILIQREQLTAERERLREELQELNYRLGLDAGERSDEQPIDRPIDIEAGFEAWTRPSP